MDGDTVIRLASLILNAAQAVALAYIGAKYNAEKKRDQE